MDQSYFITNSWCYGCMSNNDGLKLQTYYIQNEALRTIIQSDQIILCYLCQRVAQQAEQFMYNVQHIQVLLDNKKEFSDVEVQSIKANIRPLVNLTCTLPYKEDIIALSGIDAEDFGLKEAKLEFIDVTGDSQNDIKQEEVNITIEQEFHDIAETTEQETHDVTETQEVQSNNLDKSDCESGLSDVNRQESEKEENCIGEKIFGHVLLTKEQFRQELIQRAQEEKYLEAPFKCVDCVRHYRMKDTYDRHMELHKKTCGAQQCDLCKRWIATSEQLTYHLYQHLSRFKCRECSFIGRDRRLIRQHYRVVHEGRNDDIICALCKKVLSSKRSLNRHINTMHSHAERVKIKCLYCEKTFKTKRSLPAHLLAAHREQVSAKPYTCEVCGRSCIDKTKLKHHKRIHYDTNVYYCVECDKQYKSEHSLACHLKYAAAHVNATHLPFPCPECGQRFLNKRSLQTHVDGIHKGGILRFQCAHCDKTYTRKDTLAKHILTVHENYVPQVPPRKFPCTVCDKAFSSTGLLRSHLRTHTGEKPFKCSKCSAEFSQGGSLHNHNKIVHLGLKRKKIAKGAKRRSRKALKNSETFAESSDFSN